MLASLHYGAWLAEMVLDSLGELWFVSLPLLLVAAVAWMRARAGGPGGWL